MKFNLSQFVRRIPFKPLLLLVSLILTPPVVIGQTQPVATFTGTITSPPQVNATTFVNSGTWSIFTEPYPYQTANTLNYTNEGTMIGSVGWEFDLGPSTSGGPRSMSANFFNDSRGTIESGNGLIYNPSYGILYPFVVSYLTVSATNVVNKGTIIGNTAGNITLNGVNVNLSRGLLGIGSVATEPSCSVNNYTLTNFTAATAIYDAYWATNGLNNFNVQNLWDGTRVSSPPFQVDEPCGMSNMPEQMTFVPTLADSLTNNGPLGTNNLPSIVFNQAVFVAVSDPNIFPADSFSPDPDNENPSNLFEIITVRLTSALGGSLYLSDRMGSYTNHGFLNNITVLPGSSPVSPCTDPTYRPGNYNLERADCQGYFASGTPGQGPPTNTFFYNSAFSNSVVSATYAAYSAYVDDLVRSPTGAALTNLPGRIVVNATNLDLTDATIDSGGAEINLHADNFLGSTGAVITCQNLSYNLGSAKGHLNVINLATNSPVPALHGTVSAWSAVWTNGLQVVTTQGTNTVTNSIPYVYHVLLVDARQLSSTTPETLQDLILHSTNMTVSDSATVMHDLLFDGQSLTLDGSLGLSAAALPDWNSSIAPSLLYFTNNGSLAVPNDAHFGDDTPNPYDAIVNKGNINVGGGETIDSVYYQSSGDENAPGGYFVTASNGKIQNGAITSGQDMDFTGGFLKLDNSTLVAGNALNFTLTNALYDSGGSANNTLSCNAGFNLWVRPGTGDLLGTSILSQAPNGAEVDSVWAGEDRGAKVTGYSNNVAIGQLILSPQGGGVTGFPSKFVFSGPDPTQAYGMYVDLLDLSHITNLTEMLATDPNLVIYYAAAKLPSKITVLNSNGVPVQEVETNNPFNGQSYYVVANGGSGQVPQEAEEVLNGQLDGHLRWVTNFAGPNSSVDVIIKGQTVAVNRALRYSLIIDSNGDGYPNGVDPNPPFDAPPFVLTSSRSQTKPPAKGFAISWLALTNMPYQVQYTTSLPAANWLPLLNYTNTGLTNVTVTVWDTNAVSGQRYYRVRHPSP